MAGPDATLLIATALVFGCVALVSFAISQTLTHRRRVSQRFGASSGRAGGEEDGAVPQWYHVDPARLGVNAAAQRRLRGELIRAGHFSPRAVSVFTLARLGLLIALPMLALLFLVSAGSSWGSAPKFGVAGILFLLAYYLPSAYLSRGKRLLEAKYRVTFPDLLDMLVVCINAGLSLDAALDRVTRELGPGDTELRANLNLMAGERRAGKSTIEALKDFADRLGLREARSLAALLQQTIELGTDVAVALTTFSDEMRDKRMARAEEKAASLPPKLTLPLGLFIFPVILIVVLTPAVLRIIRTVAQQ